MSSAYMLNLCHISSFSALNQTQERFQVMLYSYLKQHHNECFIINSNFRLFEMKILQVS